MAAREALALCLLLAAAPALAQMYKCVDERGVTHYSDKPRPGCKGGEVDIRPIPSVSGSAPSRPTDLSSQDADFKRRQIEREHADAKERAALEQRCARLRQEHSVLASGIRVGTLGAKGERIYVDDAARDARLALLKEEMRTCP